MASDSYREAVQPEKVENTEPQKSGDGAGVQVADVDVPYTEYAHENNHPYIVDHFKLGDTWQDKMGGFKDEVDLIEEYFKKEIDSGNLQNNIDAVQSEMKKIYKLCNIDKNERTTMQIEKMAAYIDFLNKVEGIRSNYKKYGNA